MNGRLKTAFFSLFCPYLKSAIEFCLYALYAVEARWVLLYIIYYMGLSMEDLGNILEHELESAFEVKNKDSLHRAVRLIAENTVGRREYDSGIGQLKSDVRLIAERMEQGFQRMDERFEAVDKRFEAIQTQMDRRFDEAGAKSRLQTAFLGLGLTIVTTAVLLVNFLR